MTFFAAIFSNFLRNPQFQFFSIAKIAIRRAFTLKLETRVNSILLSKNYWLPAVPLAHAENFGIFD